MIRVGLVGAGRWGQTLVRSVLGNSDRIEFVRVVTRTPSKAADFAAETGLTIDDDFDALLADPGIDAVVLATPHSQHLGQILSAAKAGKHVFVEKPLALDAASARAAFEATQKVGVVLALGHNRRCLPAYIHLRKLIDEGALGQILHAEGNFSGPSAFRQTPGDWRANADETPAGGMTGKGIHTTDLMISLLGPVAAVSTISRRQVLPYGMDDTTLVALRFVSGQTGSLSTITATPNDWRLQIYGTVGWAEVRDEDHFRMRTRDGETIIAEFDKHDCERAILEWFADTIETGRPWAVSEREAVANTALLETVALSIREANGCELCVDRHAQK
jgi:predicted dehydrogenase